MPIHIPDKAEFRPSNETLNMWLATRKPDLLVGGATIPGLFSDTGNAGDSMWFFFGALGELLGLLTSVYAGLRFGGIFLFLAALGIVLFILCDLAFAWWLHRNKALECRLRSERVVAEDKKKIIGLQNRLDQGKTVDFLLRTGIITIAFTKTLGIIFLGVFSSLILYVPFLIIYLLVAYVHLNHTGYCLAYWITEHKINKEHAQLATNLFDTTEMNGRVSTQAPLKDLPIKHSPHAIESDGPTSYVIRTKGVLTDDDIVNLLDGQDAGTRLELMKACRRLQLESTPSPK